jgi:sugar phosphate isomerase/epimerase
MQFGVCTGPENAGLAKAAGADFLEGHLQNVLRPMDDSWAPPVAPKALPLPLAAYNCFLPGDIKVTGPSADLARLRAYTERACNRARELGSAVIVFGSGGARNFPAGWLREKAEEQLVEAMRVVGPVAHAAGVTIVMEPLNKAESNILNTVPEGVALLGRAKVPGLAMLCDFFHMAVDKEPLEDLDAAKGLLAHVHIAEPAGRIAPAPGMTDYRPFLRKLKELGYDGRISLECGWKDLKTQLAPSLEFLRREWQAA